jgi:hypothetical protein
MELLSFENLRQTLEEYGQEVRNLYQDKLITHDRIATGELLNSVEFQVEGDGQRWEVSLNVAEYWKYVENDTRPHWPPVNKILEWIRAKPVLPRPDKDGKLPTPEGLAFLISRKISRAGTKGTHDLEESIEEINEKYRDKIALAIAKDGETFYKLFDIRGQLAEK